MAETLKTVKSSGGDYSTLSAWEAGQQKTIAAGDTEYAECYNFQDTTSVVIDGWTTVATGYIKIGTPTAERHTGTRGTGYRLVVNGNHGIFIYEDFVRINGIEVRAYGGSYDGIQNLWSVSSSAVYYVENCLVYDCGRYGISMVEGRYNASNNIVMGNTSDGIRIERGNITLTAYCYNNTSCANGTYGINRVDGTAHSKNNYCGGNTTADYNGTFSTKSKSGSSDTTGTASYQSINYSTSAGAYFTSVTAGSQNLHIGASSSLKDVADDLSGDANYPITTDIDGTTRSGSWDIGADEYVSASAVNTYMFNTLLGVG